LQNQPLVGIVSNFIFLASAHEGDWPVLSLTVSSSHWQCTVDVHNISELVRRCRWCRNLDTNFCPGVDLIPQPLRWQSNTLTNPSFLVYNIFINIALTSNNNQNLYHI